MNKKKAIRLIEEYEHILEPRDITICHVTDKSDLDFALILDLFYKVSFEMKEFNHPLNEGKHSKLIRARLINTLWEMKTTINDAIEAMKDG